MSVCWKGKLIALSEKAMEDSCKTRSKGCDENEMLLTGEERHLYTYNIPSSLSLLQAIASHCAALGHLSFAVDCAVRRWHGTEMVATLCVDAGVCVFTAKANTRAARMESSDYPSPHRSPGSRISPRVHYCFITALFHPDVLCDDVEKVAKGVVMLLVDASSS